jgi:hypothetical protein
MGTANCQCQCRSSNAKIGTVPTLLSKLKMRRRKSQLIIQLQIPQLPESLPPATPSWVSCTRPCSPLSPPHSWPGPRTPHLPSPDQRAANHARASRDWPAASSLPSFPIQSSIQLSAVVLCSLHFIPFHVLVLKTATWSSSFYDCAIPTPDIRATQTCLRQGKRSWPHDELR